MEIGKGATESNGFVLGKAKLKPGYEDCIRCLELWDKVISADDKCLRLDLDICKKDSFIVSLESKLGGMEFEKLKLENEVALLKQRNAELENRIQNLKEEEGKVTRSIIENKLLECEKKKAEIDISSWKLKYKELEMKLMEMEKKLSAGRPLTVEAETNSDVAKVALGTPQNPITTPHRLDIKFKGLNAGREYGFSSGERNPPYSGLTGEGTPPQNMFPSTPGPRPPFTATIEISDSDDTADPDSKNVENLTGVRSGVHPSEKGPTSGNKLDDEENACYFKRPPMTKRQKARRAARVFDSESENTSDDNIPICRLVRKKRPSANVSNAGNDSFSRKKSMRDGEKNGVFRNSKSLSGKGQEDESRDKEGESSGGFIASSSDESSEGPEGEVGYGEVMSGIRKGRKWKMDWEYEADMLADLGKCSDLCMKAVCAIYRRQTSEEQSCQATLVCNGRGFSYFHAQRGSAMAEFLTSGNPNGEVNKTADEVRNFDSGGVEYCRKLATHYSRQLFEIYKNREDPFWHP